MPADAKARRPTSRAAPAVVAAAAALLLAAAAASVLASFASYAAVKRRLDAFASDHDAAFDRHRFTVVTWELRAAAAILLIAVIALWLSRARLVQALASLLASFGRSARSTRTAASAALRRESPLHLAALAGVVLAAFLVRLDFLFQPMRYDEAGTYIHYASEPVYIGLSSYTAPNNHLLHTLLVHVSTVLLGNEPWAIRLPAFAAGILLVPAAYLAARLHYDRHAALLAAALVAVSSRLVEYSTNARGYTLQTLLFLLLLALASVLGHSEEPAAWFAFAVLSALGFWVVPTMLYGLAVVVTWLVATILSEGRHGHLLARRLVPSLAGAAVLTLVLYAPPIISAGPHALLRNDFVRPRGLASTAGALPRSLWNTMAGWNRDLPLSVALLLALGFLVAVVAHRRVSRFRFAPALAAAVVLPIVLAQRVVPYDRVWLFLLPLYLITAAAGIVGLAAHLRTRRLFAPGVAALALVTVAALGAHEVSARAVYRSEDTSTFRAAEPVVRFLEPRLGPNARILAAPPPDQILEYYLDERGLDGGRMLYGNFPAGRLFVVVKTGRHEYRLRRVLGWRPGSHVGRSHPVLVRRFDGALVYELAGRR
jgi:hypothetical protein